MSTKRKSGRPIPDAQRKRPRISLTLDTGTLRRLDDLTHDAPRRRAMAIDAAVGLLVLLNRATETGKVEFVRLPDGDFAASQGPHTGAGPGWEEALAGLLFKLGKGQVLL